jgi:hypothetical protein
MAEAHSLTVLFRPGMYPADRHAIEDELEEALGDLGEISGGGTAVDLSECDIAVEVTDLEAGLRVLREVLRRLEVPESTVILQSDRERVEYRVYESAGAGQPDGDL